jgi:hypothetical protein
MPICIFEGQVVRQFACIGKQSVVDDSYFLVAWHVGQLKTYLKFRCQV